MSPKDLEEAVNRQRYVFHGDTREYLGKKLEHPIGFFGSLIEGYPVTSFSLDPEKAIQHALNRAGENDAKPVLIAINGILYLERMFPGKEVREVEVEGVIPAADVIIVDSEEKLKTLYSLGLERLISKGETRRIMLLGEFSSRLYSVQASHTPNVTGSSFALFR